MKERHFIAIGFARGPTGGRDHTRPCVFGMGRNEGAARVDADQYDIEWDTHGYAVLEVGPEIAAKVRESGLDIVNAEQLGFRMRLDVRGYIVGAEPK